MESKEESSVIVKKSTICNGGRGVFVNADILLNQRICYYDGYQVDSDNCNKESSVNRIERPYSITIGSYCIVGYLVPKNKLGLGQLINDANMPDLIDFPIASCLKDQITFLANSFTRYMSTVIACNVVITQFENRIWFLTAHDLKKDEELFFHYGCDYWYNRCVGGGTSLDISGESKTTSAIKALVIYFSFHKSISNAINELKFINKLGEEAKSNGFKAHKLQVFIELAVQRVVNKLLYICISDEYLGAFESKNLEEIAKSYSCVKCIAPVDLDKLELTIEKWWNTV